MIPANYTAGRYMIRCPCCLFLIRGMGVSPALALPHGAVIRCPGQ